MTTDPTVMSAVRGPVRDLLASSPAFLSLERDQQKELYKNMLSLGAELAQQAVRGELPEALADKTKTHGDMIKETGMAGAQVAGATLRQVRFPEFVSGLIKGVFQAIVDSSIQQMQAYGDLLQTVTGTVESFAAKLSDGDAAMFAALKEPKTYEFVAKGKNGKASLKMRGRELNDKQLAQVLTNYKLQMAQERRGLLREMVFMGLNRVVVTDGQIYSKLVFHIDTSSTVDTHSEKTSGVNANASIAQMPMVSWLGFGGGANHTSVSTVDINSASNMTIDITGEVKVNFKSDYFPLESFAGLYEKLRQEDPDRAARADAQRNGNGNGSGGGQPPAQVGPGSGAGSVNTPAPNPTPVTP